MPTAKEAAQNRPDLAVTREPVGPNSIQDSKTVGSQAVMDAVIIVGVAWAVLFALTFSLRKHNI